MRELFSFITCVKPTVVKFIFRSINKLFSFSLITCVKIHCDRFYLLFALNSRGSKMNIVATKSPNQLAQYGPATGKKRANSS
jgi:hypothetical protein